MDIVDIETAKLRISRLEDECHALTDALERVSLGRAAAEDAQKKFRVSVAGLLSESHAKRIEAEKKYEVLEIAIDRHHSRLDRGRHSTTFDRELWAAAGIEV